MDSNNWTDYLSGVETKWEVFNFDNEPQESYYYKELKTNPGFTDADFGPQNRAYGLSDERPQAYTPLPRTMTRGVRAIISRSVRRKERKSSRRAE